MKKLFVSAGLVAAGATSVQSVCGQNTADAISPKAWSVSGTLRAFYDDNYNIAANRKGSGGFEVSPSVSYNLPLQQSDMGFRYTYGLYYYQDRQDLGLDPVDQSHQLDLWLDHAINERWHVTFDNTFAVGQEPELLGASIPQPGGTTLPGAEYRVQGNNIANHAKLELDTQWTHLFGTSLHYQNDFYDYDNTGSQSTNTITEIPPSRTGPAGSPGFSTVTPSLAGLLNRVEQSVGLDLNWTLSPTTKIFTGYSFGLVNYFANEQVTTFNYILPGPTAAHLVYNSDSRDSYSHNFYVGLDYQLTANLALQGTLGAEYTDNYNDPLQDSTSWSPTANVSLTYTYSSGSYAQLGVTQGENATDVAQVSANGSLTEYQYSTVVFADINQKITQKLMGSVIARYIYSTFEGGPFDEPNNEYNLGVNLSYQINRHFSAEAGYNYDNLHSEAPGQGFSRNRVYIGMGANY